MKLSREVKTGILVLSGILAVIFGFSYLKSSSLFDNSSTYYAVYDNVGGLQTGTKVSINGLVVGNVTSIRFKNDQFKSVVTISVNEGYGFSKNSLAEIYDTGIIGGKGIQIVPVFDDATLAMSGDTLISSVKPGITDLVQEKLTPLQMKVEGAVTNVDSLLTNVNDVFDARTKLELRQSIAGLNKLISSFQVSVNGLNEFLKSNKKELDSSIQNVNTITSNFAVVSKELAESDLTSTVSSLKGTVANLNTLLQKIENGEGSLGKLASDDKFYKNLSNASKELNLLLQDFRLNPKRYVNVSVFGKKQKEYELPENDPAADKEN